MDSDQALNVLIKLGFIGADQAEAAKKAIKEVATASDEASESTKKLGEETVNTGAKTEDAGEKASHSGEKHDALRAVMSELDRISPGLGHALHLVGEAYLEAGTAAEVAAGEAVTFTTAMEELIATLGPLLIAMLAIEAAMKYWEMYKEKVKEAADANNEACKRIEDSTRSAIKAVRELDEAMHPKEKDLSSKDEENLKRQLDQLEELAKRRKELNKADEENALAGAKTPAEKEAIHKQFEYLDALLNDWREKQKAAIEESMVGEMTAQLQQLDEAKKELIRKSHAEYQYGELTGDWTRYHQTTEQLQNNADEGKKIREKLDDLNPTADTDQQHADFDSQTNTQVFGKRGRRYISPNAGDSAPGQDADLMANINNLIPTAIGAEYSHFEGGLAFTATQTATIANLSLMLEAAHQNSKQILALIVDGIKRHQNVEALIAQVHAQVNNAQTLGGA